MSNIIGKASLTLVKRINGSTEYVYAGAPCPGDADPDTLARLLEEGFLVDADPDEFPAGGMQVDVPGQVDTEIVRVSSRKAAAVAKAATSDAETPPAE